MYLISALAVLIFPALNAAQDYGNSGNSGSKSSSAAAASGTPTSSASPGVHSVAVGQGGLTFSPNSLTAAVGDQVEFHFDSPTHSVAQGDFNNACQPLNSSSFWSGYPGNGVRNLHSEFQPTPLLTATQSPPFTITVNSTDPIWFYCTQVSHCQAGMVGVINPP